MDEMSLVVEFSAQLGIGPLSEIKARHRKVFGLFLFRPVILQVPF